MVQDHTINTVDQAQLKRVYGAMTDDYYKAAEQLGGPKARASAVRADAYYGAMRQRVSDVLDNVMKASSPEQAFDRLRAMAGSTARADQRQLETLKRSVPPEAWDQVSAGVIRGMGKGADGSFSMSTLATNWGKLSPAGRTVLFGGNRSMANEKALSSLMKIAADTRAAAKFYNSSQSGNHLVTALMLEEPVRNALEGHVDVHSTAAMAALAGLGYGASRLLASPGFARLALMAAQGDSKAAVTDVSSRLTSYDGQNPDLAAHVQAFRNDFLTRVRANAPVTTPACLAASGQSRR